jgi:hypothetical protein
MAMNELMLKAMTKMKMKMTMTMMMMTTKTEILVTIVFDFVLSNSFACGYLKFLGHCSGDHNFHKKTLKLL